MAHEELSESAEEVLARLWVAKNERGEAACPMSEIAPQEREAALAELLESGLVEQDAEMVSLTAAGQPEAEAVVRRERLAERLLTDVLDLGEEQAAEEACRFEHVLRRGIVDEICTLLGHPRVCPHGSPIPPGECCREGTRSAGKIISALVDLAPGQAGVIAYIQGRRRQMMQRLLAMGAVPGTPVALLQKFPAYVFQLGHSQVAVDRETAQDIYVRITGRRPAPAAGPPWFTRPFRGLRFRGGRRGR